jgi:hypothetical protein
LSGADNTALVSTCLKPFDPFHYLLQNVDRILSNCKSVADRAEQSLFKHLQLKSRGNLHISSGLIHLLQAWARLKILLTPL